MLYVKNMGQLDKNDLAQMNEDYFKSLAQERLVEVAKNLHALATELWEKQQQNSANSSQPPSKNNPYTSLSKKEEESPNSDSLSESDQTGQNQNQTESKFGAKSRTKSSRKPGKQLGAKGFGRKQPLKAEIIIPHYPHQCAACNQALIKSDAHQRYMGHYVLELEPEPSGFRIGGQLQQADILHLDETHWYESGTLHWLWVAITSSTAVFHIGSRRKEELSHLVQEAFMGWLVSDGYAVYRSHPKRQRCVAHLIRKAVAITGAINQKARKSVAGATRS
jgi:hypothetical protein